jgi:hypothetical protein
MTQVEDRERTVADISEAEKVEFLQSIYAGLDRQEAAKALGYKGKHFRALCSPNSPYFDEEFKVAYDEAQGSFEHAESRLERLRAETWRRAMTDSDRLLEKLNMVHDPDWSVLRQKDLNVNVRAVISQYLDGLPASKLEKIIALLDEGHGQEVIEGIAHELPVTAGGNDAP